MVIDDIRKLNSIKAICPAGRGIVVFDDASYLNRPRLDKILASRGSQNSDLKVYLMQRSDSGMLRWVHI